MQDRSDTMDRTDTGQIRCRTDLIPWTGRMQDRSDTGQDECRTGWMPRGGSWGGGEISAVWLLQCLTDPTLQYKNATTEGRIFVMYVLL